MSAEGPVALPHDGDGEGDGDGSRCGYVALIGRPNVGKSTLMNCMLGHKLSIVTAKPQTTRHRICGIKSVPEGQVIYVDTPGLHLAARSALNRYMNRVAQAAILDVDVVLFLVEALRWSRQDSNVARALKAAGAPVILVVNKIDLVPDKSRLLQFLSEGVAADEFSDVFLVSARRGDGVDELERSVLERLPFSRPYYDQDQLTDRSERFLVGELVREQLMRRMHQEIPYALTVAIESFKREKALVRISAVIWVETEGQKKIVIGKSGNVLKQVGTGARKAAEALLGERIHLQLWVKVSRGWSDSERRLRQLGYDEAG